MPKIIFRVAVLVAILAFFCVSFIFADEYDATVTTSSGSYTVPVEVEGGEVTEVHWPNGGNMHVSGATISGGEADGYNSRGDSINIELDGYGEE